MLSWFPPGEAGTEALATAEIFQFEDFRFDQRSGGLFREAERDVLVPVAIGSRALDVLSVLVERPGELVSKNQILDTVWPGTAVEEKIGEIWDRGYCVLREHFAKASVDACRDAFWRGAQRRKLAHVAHVARGAPAAKHAQLHLHYVGPLGHSLESGRRSRC